MLTITRKLEFDAGHRIPDHKSQCRNLHGHRYTLEITLTGAVIEVEGSSDNGMIMDFSDIKALAKEHLVDVWDHAFLVYEKDDKVREFLATQRHWLEAGLVRAGLPAFTSARMISFAAFLGLIAVCWRLVERHQGPGR